MDRNMVKQMGWTHPFSKVGWAKEARKEAEQDSKGITKKEKDTKQTEERETMKEDTPKEKERERAAKENDIQEIVA